jgi:hypothetical protein
MALVSSAGGLPRVDTTGFLGSKLRSSQIALLFSRAHGQIYPRVTPVLETGNRSLLEEKCGTGTGVAGVLVAFFGNKSSTESVSCRAGAQGHACNVRFTPWCHCSDWTARLRLNPEVMSGSSPCISYPGPPQKQTSRPDLNISGLFGRWSQLSLMGELGSVKGSHERSPGLSGILAVGMNRARGRTWDVHALTSYSVTWIPP